MKLKSIAAALVLIAICGAHSPEVKAELCSGRGEIATQDIASSFSLWPLWTTTAIICGGDFDKEIHAHLVMREASSLIEEGGIYQPSFLTAYADSRGVKTKAGLEKFAAKVLLEGVK